MGAIVDLQFDRLADRLTARNITLTLSDEARNWLAGKGYDPRYGARPLKRTLQTELQNKLAEAILSGTIGDGDAVRADLSDYDDGIILITANTSRDIPALSQI
jgi:ATP-dependent Clp protease ATP-binding subunit ClpB